MGLRLDGIRQLTTVGLHHISLHRRITSRHIQQTIQSVRRKTPQDRRYVRRLTGRTVRRFPLADASQRQTTGQATAACTDRQRRSLTSQTHGPLLGISVGGCALLQSKLEAEAEGATSVCSSCSFGSGRSSTSSSTNDDALSPCTAGRCERRATSHCPRGVSPVRLVTPVWHSAIYKHRA